MGLLVIFDFLLSDSFKQFSFLLSTYYSIVEPTL